MEIVEYFKQKKELYSFFISIIENDNTEYDNYQEFINFLEIKKIIENPEEFKDLLHLISEVYKNHYQTLDFFQRIEQFLYQITENIKQTFTNSEIFDIFKNNKRILHYLFTNKIIELTETVINFIVKKSSVNGTNYCHFFFNKIQDSIDDVMCETIRRELLELDPDIFDTFDEKCKIGQNDSYVCELIRNDSIEDFVRFVTKNNLNLSSKINQSIFETNPFLMKNDNTSLIEYAAFFGSIQIFQYLRLNNVVLTSSLWLYAIHGKNADIIHLLEDNGVYPIEKNYEKCIEESIKCHHNDIANYFLDNEVKIRDENDFTSNIVAYGFHYYNYFYLPDDIENKFIFHYACMFNYYSLVDLLMLNKISININSKIDEKTALHLAAIKGNFEIMNLLLSQPEIEIGENEFANCTKIKEIEIPPSVTQIGPRAFFHCSSLKKIIMPSSIVSIGRQSFESCISLKEIIIPSSLQLIDEYTFENCSLLQKIIIPSSVTSIKINAFYGCKSLKEVIFEQNSSLTNIQSNVFNNCISLESIEIPQKVVKIGESCFNLCNSLKRITIPSSVTEIEYDTFYDCKSLEEIKYEVPCLIKKIEFNQFTNCTSLKEFTIPSSVTEIDSHSFEGCSSLKKVIIPSSVKLINSYVFDGCSSLEEITIPSSVTKIGEYVFNKCTSLKQASISYSLKIVGYYVFNECSFLEKISIPSSVTEIGSFCFGGCSSLFEIKFDKNSSLSLINSYAFEFCKSLVEIFIPCSVKKIDEGAFSECSSLEKITFKNPSSLKSIGPLAFQYCISLKELFVPGTVTEIGTNAFLNCNKLRNISIPSIAYKEYIGIDSNIEINLF